MPPPGELPLCKISSSTPTMLAFIETLNPKPLKFALFDF